jgi:hypothetical protein
MGKVRERQKAAMLKDEFIFPLSPLLPYLPYLPCTPALLLLPQDCFGGRGTR